MNIDIQKNISLAPYTTFRIGGPAKFFVEIKNENDLMESLVWAKDNNQKIFFLGGGSNLLVSDRGFAGLVLKIQNGGYEILNDLNKAKSGENIEVFCGAGAGLAGLALELAKKNLSGLEWSVGIPRATVGGSIKGNAGAFGVAMSDSIEAVKVFDLEKKEFKKFNREECQFVYRDSIFKKKEKYLIWGAILKFEEKDPNYIQNLIDKSVQHRKNSYPKFPSAGSVFKNTAQIEVVEKHNVEIAENARRRGVVNEDGKIPIGFLIEQFGLMGKQIGGAKVSEEHGNFIINTGQATAEDVIILISLIKQKIRDNYGVQLEEELQMVGF